MTHLTYSASSGNFGRFLLKPNTQDCVRCPPSLLMSYGERAEVLVRIPRILLRRALCHGGKRFCLSVGSVSSFEFRVSGFWFQAFANLCALCGSQTPSLFHSPTLNSPTSFRPLADSLQAKSASIKDHSSLSRYSRKALACHAA